MFTSLTKSVLSKRVRQFSTSSKYEIPTLGEYSQLFANSGIIEQLIPREVTDADQFEKAYPTVL